MSRYDTVNQKIRKNIKYLFKESEILAKAYQEHIVFSYIESLCHRIVVHHDSIYFVNFDSEIGMIKKVIKDNPNSKVLKTYYSCLVKTNEMINEKYKNKSLNPRQGLRQALIEMRFIRDGKLPKQNIHVFLDKLDKEES